jgi:cephalosporin-C deacetylase-like acetyl esterase
MTDAERLKAYDEEISREMPKDFKDWWENSKEEWPLIARYVLERRRGEIEWLEIALIAKDQKIKELEEEIEILCWELAGEDL